MGCCIAIALVFALVRTAWFRVVRRTEPTRAGFAPPAHRPAPGSAAPVSARPPAPGPAAATPTAGHHPPIPRPFTPAWRPRAAVVLPLAAALGLGGYAELLAVLTHTGVVPVDAGEPGRRARELVVRVLLGAVQVGRQQQAATQGRESP